MPKEFVILVDEQDNPIGLEEKMSAHEKGLLHRAFSILIFNEEMKMLIHKRAESKYHCGGLWTNACCSHPRDQETLLQAARRRAQEELGLSITPEYLGNFIYQSEFSNGLTEHEFDHVFCAQTNLLPNPNPEEVADIEYLNAEQLILKIQSNPSAFTPWFLILLQQDCVTEYFKQIPEWKHFYYPL